MRFLCPNCRRDVPVPAEFHGRTIYCPACGQPMAIPAAPPTVRAVPEPSTADAHVHYAGFWIRVVADIVDALVLLIPGFILDFAWPFVGSTILWIVYKSLCLANWNGQTLGKKACGIQVVSENLGPVSVGQAFGRTFAELLSTLILMIGYIMAGFDGRKQALHDKIAGTLHIYREGAIG